MIIIETPDEFTELNLLYNARFVLHLAVSGLS